MKLLNLIVCLIVFVATLSAAETRTTPEQRSAERLAVQNARAAAQRNDPTTAEQLLTAMNRAQPGTSWWHLETAQRLIELAHDVPREGPRGNSIPAIVGSALQHLATADNLATDVRHKANIKAFTGLVHERFRGDHAAARSSYQAAATLAPDNAIAAKHATRLQRLADLQSARTKK